MSLRLFVALSTVTIVVSSSPLLADESDRFLKVFTQYQSHFEAGEFDKAEADAQQMIAIVERHFDKKPILMAPCLERLADAQFQAERDEQAVGNYRRVIAIRDKLVGKYHEDQLNSLYNLAIIHLRQDQHEKAINPMLRVVRIREKDRTSPSAAAFPNRVLGNVSRDLHRTVDAVIYYRRALELLDKDANADKEEVANVTNSLGLVYYWLGSYADAEPLVERSLQASKDYLDADDLGLATAYGNVAAVYMERGRFADAVTHYQQQLTIQEAALDSAHADLAPTLRDLGDAHFAQKEYDLAEPHYQRALEILEREVDEEDIVEERSPFVSRLAAIRRLQGRHAEAEQLVSRAIELGDTPDAPLPNDPGISPTFSLRNVVGLVDEEFGRYEFRAKLRWELGRREEALADLERAIDLADGTRARWSYFTTTQGLASAFAELRPAFEQSIAWQVELGHADPAFAAAERSLARALADAITSPPGNPLAGVERQEADRLRRRKSEAQSRLADLQQQLEAALYNGAAADRKRANRVAELRNYVRAAQQDVVNILSEIQNASPEYHDHYWGRVSGRESFHTSTLDEVQQQLSGEHNLVLEYFVGEDKSFLFVIPSLGDSSRAVTLEIDEDLATRLGMQPGPLTTERLTQALTIDGKSIVQRLARPADDGSASDPSEGDAAKLHERLALLWELLIPSDVRSKIIEQKYAKLLVIPDGSLVNLPFEALVIDAHSRKYLVDVEMPIAYAPSATLLISLKRREARPLPEGRPPVLTVGDPAYSNTVEPQLASADAQMVTALTARSRFRSGGGHLTRLPHSGVESRWVAQAFQRQGVSVAQLSDKQATESKVRSVLSSRQIVHLACHGLVDTEHGNLFGALALAPGSAARSDPGDDGFLTLAEIYELRLADCELAILSACDTNFGPTQRGEGVWALSRGFLVAGARRAVASNWLVDDEAAASLVSIFASSVAKQQSAGQHVDYAAALHLAKRRIRNDAKWQSPYYWATFVLLGPP